MQHIFRTSTTIRRPIDEVFAFFSHAGNLGRITPPELRFEITTPQPITMGEGTLIEYRLQLLGIPFGWKTVITSWEPPHMFIDEQLRGPYRQWIHTHRFRSEGDATVMDDEVRWALPLWPFGQVAYPVVRAQIRRIFRYRERMLRQLLPE